MISWLFTVGIALANPLFSGVVVQSELERVFVAQESGGVWALNTTTGRRLWRTTAADIPLEAHDRWLVAVGERTQGMEIAVFDTRTGARASRCVAWTPPDWIAGLEDVGGASIRYSAHWDGAGAFLVTANAARHTASAIIDAPSTLEQASASWVCVVPRASRSAAVEPSRPRAGAPLRVRTGADGRVTMHPSGAGREHALVVPGQVIGARVSIDGQHFAAAFVSDERSTVKVQVWDARGTAQGPATDIDIGSAWVVVQGVAIGADIGAEGQRTLAGITLASGELVWSVPVRDFDADMGVFAFNR